MTDPSRIVGKLWSYSSVLRDDGLRGALEQIEETLGDVAPGDSIGAVTE